MALRIAIVVVSAVLALAVSDGLSAPSDSPFRVERLADDLYVVRPIDPADPARTNALLVRREDGPLVVEAQPTEDAAREMLRAIAHVDDRPVRYLVLSHAHAESSGGVSAFPRETLVVASRPARAALADPGFDAGAEARERSPTWRAAERPRLPTLAVEAPATLFDARVDVVVLPVARAHSDGDLIVHVPSANLVWAGSIVFGDRNPYARDADLGGWIGVLSSILRMQPAFVLPLRGEPADAREVGIMRQHFAWLRAQVDTAFVDNVPAEQIAERLLASPDLQQHFDPSASPSFLRGLLDHAVRESVEQRRKHGIE